MCQMPFYRAVYYVYSATKFTKIRKNRFNYSLNFICKESKGQSLIKLLEISSRIVKLVNEPIYYLLTVITTAIYYSYNTIYYLIARGYC